MNHYKIATKRRFSASEELLTYHSEQEVSIGSIVQVPFGKSTTMGLVMEQSTKPSFETKPISKVLTTQALSSEQIELIKWIAEYYHSPISEVMQLFIPTTISAKPRKKSPAQKRTSQPKQPSTLNTSQQRALDHLLARSPKSTIIHGITGSGKTRMYIERARRALADKTSAVILVPEINLTPQLVAEFQKELGHVYFTHSRLTAAERRNIWLEIAADDEPKIIIGPRSALFLPVRDLGVVVIDEFHEQTYKQDKTPKYDTTRVAARYARLSGAQLILGSATPTISEYYLAEQTDKDAIITITDKARSNTAPPQIEQIDMRGKDYISSYAFWLSKKLHESIKQTLDKGEQSLLFLNRRGSARISLCNDCGWHAECPRCFLPYTLHSDKKYLKCHVCDNTKPVLSSCPDCNNVDIVYRGVGTKQIESDLKRIFPGARIARFDGDNSKEETLNALYDQVRDGSIDILIGTQTLVKGLDLPKLGLVAAVAAETSLMMPDFSSSERTFQLINQLVGRVGRDERDSKIIIQTYNPQSHVIKQALHGQFDEFYTEEIASRRKYLYPPFVFMLKLNVIYADNARAEEAAREFKHQIKDIPGITVLGPAPAFYERVNKKYNWQLVIKSKSRGKLTEVVSRLPNNGKWRFELDPSDLL